MNRHKRSLIEYSVVINPIDHPTYTLARVIGVDLGTPDWANGRRAAINPDTGDRSCWIVTDVETGAALYTGYGQLRWIEADARDHHSLTSQKAWRAAVERATRLRAEADASGIVGDRREHCRQKLCIKPNETVEAI